MGISAQNEKRRKHVSLGENNSLVENSRKGGWKVGISAQNEKRRPNVSLGEKNSIVENSGKRGLCHTFPFLKPTNERNPTNESLCKDCKIFISRNCFICVKKIFH